MAYLIALMWEENILFFHGFMKLVILDSEGNEAYLLILLAHYYLFF